jgi:transcriptional regulator with XRE-family HTH domain
MATMKAMMTMAEPNARLRAVRQAMHMSQAELARAVRAAGQRSGEPNSCSVRNVQRWEAGDQPRGAYVRALERATGQPADNLGIRADQTYGVDTEALAMPGESWPEAAAATAAAPLNGIWLSRYEYDSSGRGARFANAHYVLVVQQGRNLAVRSLPGTSAGRVIMDLTVNGQVITGTWTEETDPGGYYQGAVYHGAVQLLLDPSGRKMSGKWVGYGREWEINEGPWSLELVTRDTSQAAQEARNRPPEPRDQAGDIAG